MVSSVFTCCICTGKDTELKTINELEVTKNILFYQSLSLTLMEVFNGQPIHQQYHTGIVQLDAYHLFSIARNFKGAAFQSLVVQMITTSVPMK